MFGSSGSILPDGQRKVYGSVQEFSRIFGDHVRIRRTQLGMTQGQLAKTVSESGISVSQSYISYLEAGQRSEPSIKIVLALALLLDIPLDPILQTAAKEVQSD